MAPSANPGPRRRAPKPTAQTPEITQPVAARKSASASASFADSAFEAFQAGPMVVATQAPALPGDRGAERDLVTCAILPPVDASTPAIATVGQADAPLERPVRMLRQHRDTLGLRAQRPRRRNRRHLSYRLPGAGGEQQASRPARHQRTPRHSTGLIR
jgi:hypothetical protein